MVLFGNNLSGFLNFLACSCLCIRCWQPWVDLLLCMVYLCFLEWGRKTRLLLIGWFLLQRRQSRTKPDKLFYPHSKQHHVYTTVNYSEIIVIELTTFVAMHALPRARDKLLAQFSRAAAFSHVPGIEVRFTVISLPILSLHSCHQLDIDKKELIIIILFRVSDNRLHEKSTVSTF